MIFVDTNGWFASVVPSDPNHSAASDWLGNNSQPLLTSDYVIDETLTLLMARGEKTRALALGQQFFSGTVGTICHVTADDIVTAWTVFRDFSDKEWSFTDCTSKVVMERLGVNQAFAFDRHFRQFGSLAVLPTG